MFTQSLDRLIQSKSFMEDHSSMHGSGRQIPSKVQCGTSRLGAMHFSDKYKSSVDRIRKIEELREAEQSKRVTNILENFQRKLEEMDLQARQEEIVFVREDNQSGLRETNEDLRAPKPYVTE